LCGYFVAPRKRYERRQRRHGRAAPQTARHSHDGYL
jgi:hypothetical protein